MNILKFLILFILFQFVNSSHSSNSECPQPDPLQNGTSFGCLSDGGRYQYFCNPGYSIYGPITRLCVNGSWSDTEPTCEISLGGQFSNGDIRFDTEYQIIPAVRYLGIFYRSCWTDISLEQASLLCMLAGRRAAVSVHRVDLDFGIEVSGPYITADNFSCVGDELHFSQCTFGTIGFTTDCSDGVLGISCYPYISMKFDPNLDRIRMFYNNTMLDVCDSSMDKKTADNYCRIIGKLGGAVITSVNGAQVSDKVVTNVVCSPSMRNFGDCVVTLNDSCMDGFMKIECLDTDVENSIRLTGAKDLHTGKLQIYKSGSWGDICYEAFYSKEALVACRQLGFETYLAFPKGVHGNREGDSYAVERVKCPADATNYSFCEFLTESRCNDPDEAVSIWCINEKACCIPSFNTTLLQTNSTESGLIPHGDVLRYSCIGNTVVSGSSEITCEGGTWSGEPPLCVDAKENSVRLIDGSSANEGNVQIFKNDKWNFVCDRNWNLEIGTKMCEDLGYEGALEVTKFNYYNSTTGQQFSSLECNLTNCTVTQSDCAISEAAGVICGNLQFEVRFVGSGHNETAGRVQVFYNGAWFELCKDFNSLFSQNGPTVCKQLGYTYYNQYDYTEGSEIYGEPTANATLSILCFGTKDNVGECSLSVATCSSPGFYLVCTPPETGIIRLVGGENNYEGIVEIYQDFSWKSICPDNWDDTDGVIACVELGWENIQNVGTYYGPALSLTGFGISNVGCYGNETSLSECPYMTDTSDCDRGNPATVTCHIPSQYQVQLRDTEDNINNITGRVVVYVGSDWIGVCDDDWGIPDAIVVCRSLGYDYTIKAIAGYADISADRGWNNVNCVGNETSFGDCEYSNTSVSNFFFASCYYTEGAGVMCGNYVDYDIKIREDTLIIGDFIIGIVEIRYEGEWYPICYEGNDISQYLCTELGYGNATIATTPGSDSINTSLSFNNFTCNDNESIIQCLPIPGNAGNCPSSRPVEINCISYDGRVRLIDGNETAGHVQIFHDDRWGDVCDDLWDIKDAHVVCRQLFQRGALKAILYSQFGNREADFLLDNVKCVGTEERLADCPSNGWGQHNCGGYELAGVQCLPEDCPTLVAPLNGSVDQNMSHGGYATFSCDNGYKLDGFQTVRCLWSNWGGISPNCTTADEGDIQLVDGPTSFEGHIQIFHDGEWGYICDDSWDDQDGIVACSQLGYAPNFRGISTSSYYPVYSDVSRIWLDGVNCVGSESYLTECDGATYTTHDCSVNEYAGVECFADEGRLRLINGITDLDGLLQMYENGTWHYFCHFEFIGGVGPACTQLGFQTTGSVMAEVVNTTDFKSAFCVNNYIPLYPNCLLNDVTNCLENSVVNLTCTINDRCEARLYGADYNYKGLVEFWRDGRWGGVCDGGFTLTEANVLCQQLGWPDGALSVGYDVMMSSAIPFHFQNVTCNPGEVDICNCTMDTEIDSKCTRNKAVYIECNIPADGSLRLLGGEDENSGLLEVFHLGRWGAVCDDGWTVPDSSVACKQLGTREYISSTIRSDITNEVWLDNVACSGDELFLSNCTHNGWGDHNCRGQEGIFLECLPFADIELLLTDIVYADDDVTARVQIHNNDYWYNICPLDVTAGFANQLCTHFKLENMPNVSMALELEPPADSLPSIVLISCPYEFDNLTDCVGGDVCSTDKVLGIKCRSFDNQTRLITTTGFSGLLEINHEGSWRGICDDGWDIKDATVACRQLGYSGAIRAISSLTKEEISFWLTIVNCEGHERYLDHCPFKSWDVSNCYRNEYAGVVCIPDNCTSLPTTQNGQFIGNTTHGSTIELVCDDSYVVRGSRTLECINSIWIGDMPTCVAPQEFGIRLVDSDGTNFYKGHVQVYHHDKWGYICDTTWDDKDGQTACRQLGFQGFQRVTKQSFHSNATGMSWTENVYCEENDYSLAECGVQFYDSLSSCSNGFAGVICVTLEGQVELINGTTNNTGWVRIYTQGRFRPVCFDKFGPPEVSVICKQLGYSRGVILDSGPAAISNSELTLDCDGSENSVIECVEFELEASSCYRVDAYVNCSNEEIFTVRLVEGEYEFDGQVEVYLEEGWSSVCYAGVDNGTAAVLCNALGWEYGINTIEEEMSVTELGVQFSITCQIPDEVIQNCNLSNKANCSRDDALNIECNTPPQNTLRRGHNNALEIFHDLKWGYVCDDAFGLPDANVACRHLGYPSATSFRIAVEVLTDFFWLDNLYCTGSEFSLADCKSNDFGFENCYAREGVDVKCSPHYDGTIKFEGDIPLVFLDNAFHYLCADAGKFSIHSASAICNQEGLVFADSVGNTTVGTAGLKLYPDVKFISCIGDEANVTDCHYANTNSCVIVGNLKCTDPTGLIRLIGGSGESPPTNGRVQIHNGTEWQYICPDRWSFQDASIGCSQLGFTTVSGFSSVTIDKESYNYIGTGFDCYGTETRLIDCYYTDTDICDPDKVATLSCKDLVCPQYSSINSCGSKCSESCYKDLDPLVCSAVCTEKCECYNDYIWNTTEQNVCVWKADCPNYCTENEHYYCVPACQYNCDTYKDPPKTFCNLLPCGMGCGCKDGYVRRHGIAGECVLEADCEATTPSTQTTVSTMTTPTPTTPSCPLNSQYSNCSTACPANCSTSPLEECILQCVSGCQCNTGFVLLGDDCIQKEECPVDGSINILTNETQAIEVSGSLRLFTHGNWFNICSNSIEIESIRLIEFTCDFLNYSNTEGNIFITEQFRNSAVLLNCPNGAGTIALCSYTLSECGSILGLECLSPTIPGGISGIYIGIGIGAVMGVIAIFCFIIAVIVMVVMIIRNKNQSKSYKQFNPRLSVASDVPDPTDDPTGIANPIYQVKDLEAEQLIVDDDDTLAS